MCGSKELRQTGHLPAKKSQSSRRGSMSLDHQGVDFGEIEIPDKISGETLTIELPQKEEDDKKKND